MKVVTSTKTVIRVALVDSDPLRLVGFRALLEEESDLELVSASLPEVAAQKDIDVVLIGDRPGHKLFDTMANLRAVRSSMPIIVVGHSASHEVMLNAIVSGARGYVFDGAPAGEFALAIRVVHEGSVWAPRRVLSMFIELAETQRERPLRGSSESITEREKQVLTMLVSGLSNKEIDQIGKGLGFHLLHHTSAMRLNRNFADSQLAGHLFVEHSRDYQGHHLLLPLGQRCEVVAQRLQVSLSRHKHFATSLDRLADRTKKSLVRKRLRQEFDGSRLHRLNRHRYIAVARDEDDRHVGAIVCDALLQLQAAQSGHRNVEHQATGNRRSRRGDARNSEAEAKISGCQPSQRISSSRDSRTDTSSSTTNVRERMVTSLWPVINMMGISAWRLFNSC
jgi:DNA-binding NarL/FixJ family response regulator